MTSDQPKVSVCMITYNHEKFLAQAIESALMQKTSFPIEIVVADDCSKDCTPSIVNGFVRKYPHVVRPVPRTMNLGVKRNFTSAIHECRGEYVALLEGDDYWIDEYKLQKQVDFLENNPEYILVGSNALVVDEDDGFKKAALLLNTVVESFDFTTADLLNKNPLPTLTVMFRNRVVTDFPLEYFASSIGGDRIIYMLLSRHGKCRFINQVLGVYRVHRGGVTDVYRNSTDGQLRSLQDRFSFTEECNTFFNRAFEKDLEKIRSRIAADIFALSIKTLRLTTAFRYAPHMDYSCFQSGLVRAFAKTAKFVSGMRAVAATGKGV